MAHTNDVMLAKLSAEYGTTTLGDGLVRLRADAPTFGTPTERAWYVTKLAALGVSHSPSAHLGDLANLFWSQANPFSVIP